MPRSSTDHKPASLGLVERLSCVIRIPDLPTIGMRETFDGISGVSSRRCWPVGLSIYPLGLVGCADRRISFIPCLTYEGCIRAVSIVSLFGLSTGV